MITIRSRRSVFFNKLFFRLGCDAVNKRNLVAVMSVIALCGTVKVRVERETMANHLLVKIMLRSMSRVNGIARNEMFLT